MVVVVVVDLDIEMSFQVMIVFGFHFPPPPPPPPPLPNLQIQWVVVVKWNTTDLFNSEMKNTNLCPISCTSNNLKIVFVLL